LSIKIPSIRPAIMLTIIFSIIGSFQLFNEPRLMGFLAPTVIGTDWSPNLYAYSIAFVNQDTNYAAALSFLLGFVIALLSYIFQLSANRREQRSRG
jgi:multiple sugar transport system permease protein